MPPVRECQSTKWCCLSIHIIGHNRPKSIPKCCKCEILIRPYIHIPLSADYDDLVDVSIVANVTCSCCESTIEGL